MADLKCIPDGESVIVEMKHGPVLSRGDCRFKIPILKTVRGYKSIENDRGFGSLPIDYAYGLTDKYNPNEAFTTQQFVEQAKARVLIDYCYIEEQPNLSSDFVQHVHNDVMLPFVRSDRSILEFRGFSQWQPLFIVKGNGTDYPVVTHYFTGKEFVPFVR